MPAFDWNQANEICREVAVQSGCALVPAGIVKSFLGLGKPDEEGNYESYEECYVAHFDKGTPRGTITSSAAFLPPYSKYTDAAVRAKAAAAILDIQEFELREAEKDGSPPQS